MNRLGTKTLGLAFGLSALAGLVDVAGFLKLGGTFVSFMSGNTAQLAVSLARLQLNAAGMLAGTISLFVVGVVSGSLLSAAVPWRHRLSVTLSALIWLFCVALAGHRLLHDGIALAAITLAMGAENAIFQARSEVVVGLTYMTGPLVKIGQAIASAFRGEPIWNFVPYALLWLALLSGGAIGASTYQHLGLDSLFVAIGWTLVLLVYGHVARIDVHSLLMNRGMTNG